MAFLNKIAAIEPSGISDPSSGRQINVSTTVRIMYRKINPEYVAIRNEELNKIIAQSFAASASRIVHRFRLKTPDPSTGGPEIAEIRNMQGPDAWSAMFFISVIRTDSIMILALQNGYIKAKYKARETS